MAGEGILVRSASARDVSSMARLHVQSWRETYRGVMEDAILDDPTFLSRRETFWTAALTDPRYASNRSAIAELNGSVVGIAMSGPASEPHVAWSAQLYVLYTTVDVHGLGAGAALLDAVVDLTSTTGLWVADPNPRAQAFYTKHGFVRDGDSRTDGSVNEIRMVRRALTTRS